MHVVRAAFLALALTVLAGPTESAAQGQDGPCRALVFEDDPFTVCTARAGKDAITLSLTGAEGKPHRRLPALKAHLGAAGDKVRFAMNAGMFDARGGPIGLYVEDGKRLKQLNTRDGFGNFHLKPNGVFWIDAGGKAHVTETGAYAAKARAPAWASQSGPMLVIDGELHPKFDHDGASRHIRNGVGVSAAGDAVFVISDAPVSFGKLARLFRDELGCGNALYLDGAVSALWAPALDRLDTGRALGPMVVVSAP